MSVLYEHRPTDPCDGPHDLSVREPIEITRVETSPVGKMETRGGGWVQFCTRCGLVLEFRIGEDYPPPPVKRKGSGV